MANINFICTKYVRSIHKLHENLLFPLQSYRYFVGEWVRSKCLCIVMLIHIYITYSCVFFFSFSYFYSTVTIFGIASAQFSLPLHIYKCVYHHQFSHRMTNTPLSVLCVNHVRKWKTKDPSPYLDVIWKLLFSSRNNCVWEHHRWLCCRCWWCYYAAGLAAHSNRQNQCLFSLRE